MTTTRKFIAWSHEDDEWFGMAEDGTEYLVKSPEPGVWAGWIYTADGSRECITNDHDNSFDAKRQVEEG